MSTRTTVVTTALPELIRLAEIQLRLNTES
jgi:hypothetical protein